MGVELSTDNELDEILAKCGAEQKYAPLAFTHPAQLIATFHPAMISGDVALYPWQVEESLFLAQSCFSKENPLRHILCACNGSGKDAYVIAPFAIWKAACKIRSRTIITSSSFTQLQSQTEQYIRSLAMSINEQLNTRLFVIKQMHIVCTATGSEIKMFSTDEPGRAEGYHPFPDYPKGELSVVINEGKTVSDDIYMALERCTFSRWIIVSSPGQTNGRMFNDYKRSVIYPEKFLPGKLYSRKVTAHECPHISPVRIAQERATHGEHHPWFRSARLAEFTSIDEAVVIDTDMVQKCKNFPPEHIPFGKAAGLDLSAGGDECSFIVRDGNKITALEAFKMHDNVVNYSIELFKKHGFTPAQSTTIFADHGGVGAAYAQHFREKGWELSWIQNQGRPTNPGGLYGNRGADMYFRFRDLVVNCMVIFGVDDDKLMSQLTSRYYTQHKISAKIVLEAKRDARAKGHGSPDRADALVLAFTGITVEVMRDLIAEFQGKPRIKTQAKGIPTTREVSKMAIVKEDAMQNLRNLWDNAVKFGDKRAALQDIPKTKPLYSPSRILSSIRGN